MPSAEPAPKPHLTLERAWKFNMMLSCTSSKREAWDNPNRKEREGFRQQSGTNTLALIRRGWCRAAFSGTWFRRPRRGQQDGEWIVLALLHNAVTLIPHCVKILNCLFISHPLFILIVPDKQGYFTFAFYCTHLSSTFISPRRLSIFYYGKGRRRGMSRHFPRSLAAFWSLCMLRFQISAFQAWRFLWVLDPGAENV